MREGLGKSWEVPVRTRKSREVLGKSRAIKSILIIYLTAKLQGAKKIVALCKDYLDLLANEMSSFAKRIFFETPCST